MSTALAEPDELQNQFMFTAQSNNQKERQQ
jgi:hypothetical protein